MRVPDLGFGAQRIHSIYGQYHLARLLADEQAIDLVEPFQRAQDALKERIEEAARAAITAMTSQAVRDARDDELDDTIRGFYFDLLHIVVINRQDPVFLRYFPDGMTPALGQPPAEEVLWVRNLLTKLEEEPNLELRSHAAGIEKAADALSLALEGYDAAVYAERLAVERMNEEKLRWIDAYRQSYRKLQLRFHRDEKRAERYFRPARKSSRGGEEEQAEPSEEIAESIVADRTVDLED